MTEQTTQTDVPIDTEPSMIPRITVFSKNDCYRCRQVENRLDAAGIPFREINVEEDTAPREEFGGKTPLDHVVATYGREMPVVVVEDEVWGDHWSGIRPDKLIPLIKKMTTLLDDQRARATYQEEAA